MTPNNNDWIRDEASRKGVTWRHYALAAWMLFIKAARWVGGAWLARDLWEYLFGQK